MTGRNRPMVTYYLLFGQCLRTIGGVGGFALGPLVGLAIGANVNSGPLWWVWIIGGSLLGALWPNCSSQGPGWPA